MPGKHRLLAVFCVASSAILLAGCNAANQANLTASTLSAEDSPAAARIGANGVTRPAAANVNGGAAVAGAKLQAQSGTPIVVADMSGPASAPFPAARPDFGDRLPVLAKAATAQANDQKAAGTPVPAAPHTANVQINVAQTAIRQTATGSQAPAATASAAPVAQGPVTSAVAQAGSTTQNPPAAAKQPSLFAALFSNPAATEPARADEEDPEPPVSRAEERAENSLAAPQADEIANAAASLPQNPSPAAQPDRAQPAGAVIVTTAAYAPAVVEVNGKSTAIVGKPGHKIIQASLNTSTDIASNSGISAGRYWRAAYPHVVTSCFGSTLRGALNTIGRHFGREVEVTSGHRTRGRRRSMHRFCRAADIRVPGVRPSAVARFARSIPGINGVGTYRRKSIVHIDTRRQLMVWRY